MAIFKYDYIVNISNISSSNSISNIGIISILEDIACKHSDYCNFGINEIPITHTSWMLLNWKVNILKRVKYGTKLTVKTWAKKSNKFNTYRDFEVINENGDIICKATSKWTLINIEKGSITRITDDIINLYEPEEINVFENFEVEKLIEPSNYSNEYIYTTQRRDIDVNKHMHNLNYLSLAYEALPEDVYNSDECNNIEIMYKKGIKLGDTVKCLYSHIDNSHYVTIKSVDNKDLHAIVKLY